MDLNFTLPSNTAFRLLAKNRTDYPSGLYRVILNEPAINTAIIVRIDAPLVDKDLRGGRRRLEVTKRPRKKAPNALVGELLWACTKQLGEAQGAHQLRVVDIDREPVYFTPVENEREKALYEKRIEVMQAFLNPLRLRDGILIHKGLGGLVKEAMGDHEVCRSQVYKLWSLLCKFGLHQLSLRTRLDRSGAPGVSRPCDPGGRKKPGAKTREQIAAKHYGIDLPSRQPAMSTEWQLKIRAADDAIDTPIKPQMRTRYNLIVQSGFIQKYMQVDGKLVAVEPKEGEIPTYPQVKRFLTVDTPRLLKLLQQTTNGHFKRSLRGLIARNWKGVSGPGHTWAIDSTLADIYLRSSIDRSWIIGRPVVYIIVDVWSTAVVGLYVCLTGPSWSTAKVSLFNAVADPVLMGSLWGFQLTASLNPLPTLPYVLMCDRGEYLSLAAKQTAFKLIDCMSYAPPYRPDLKGLVEVLHRIEKDAQFMFMPGAMNHRRVEFELRRSNPDESAMTIREYVRYLYLLFTHYNLSANRTKRVTTDMAAAGVFPSPAGLWRFGHARGIGLCRGSIFSDLVTDLLPEDTGRVKRDCLYYAGNEYTSPIAEAEQWTTLARNGRGWDIPIRNYPGSVSKIWTPHCHGKGLLELNISDQAISAPTTTYDEIADAMAFKLMNQPAVEHARTMHAVNTLKEMQSIKENAIKQTKEAIAKAQGTKPTMTQARIAEVVTAGQFQGSEMRANEQLRTEAMDTHSALMRQLLKNTDTDSEAEDE